MIVQPGLANGRDARTFRQLAQGRDHIFTRLLGVVGMNPDDGKDVGVFLCQFDRAPAAFD